MKEPTDACTHILNLIYCRILRRQDRPTAHSPAWEYASPPVANWRRDTDRWWRHLTKLPGHSHSIPFDPAVRDHAVAPLRFRRCLRRSMALGSHSYLRCDRFDGTEIRSHPPPCISVPQAVHASKAMPQQSLTCILTMSGSLSHCLSRYRRRELSESELEQDAVEYDKVVPVQLIS